MRLKNISSIPVKEFKVPSKSRPGLMHTVELCHDGSLLCDCEAGMFNKPCRHKNAVRAEIYKGNQELPFKNEQRKRRKRNLGS